MDLIQLGSRGVGSGRPPYFIAEIGSNHNGDMDLCRRQIDLALEAGADAVKFQSWSSQSLISAAEYDRNTQYTDTHRHFGGLREMVERYQFTPAQHREIAAYCRGVGIEFASSPFSRKEADMLVELNVPFLKIASMDITHIPLLQHVGALGKPVILSTGMASLAEIDRALATLRSAGCKQIALLHCVSLYPPTAEHVNLRNIPMLKEAFGVPVGFSDHTQGIAAALGAIALGAIVVEKHFTSDKSLPGWDHWISADPSEMKALVRDGLEVFHALGASQRILTGAELEKRRAFRRRVVLARSLEAGHALSIEDLDYKRPGYGIGPEDAVHLIGRKLVRNLQADHELEWSDLA